ncbi:hypothetical protein K788_0004722 [Paraburkholderia caribensis MBA4]|uniref:Uncharacterized protein n=1 Tax=Paraburkholderia caribensis MBA4 TaxID=1323664 RepID=A0A0P0RKE9_9BURK|nr:hypothetical protein K788_0004722 [Paraburkholderia caribensis MBA4]
MQLRLSRVAGIACDGVSRVDEPAPGSGKKRKLASSAKELAERE